MKFLKGLQKRIKAFCFNLIEEYKNPIKGYRFNFQDKRKTLSLALSLGNWHLCFTENGKNRNYGTMGAIMDFFFPYTPRLRMEASTNTDGKTIHREFFTFRAFACQLAYEFKQLFIFQPIQVLRQNPAIAFILLLGILYPKALPVIAVIGAIAYDAVSSGNTDATSLTFSHTCSGNNRFLSVGNFLQGSIHPTDITYNSVSLTSSVSNNGGTAIWTLVNPATGANDVVVSRPTANRILAGAISFSGANQTSPIDGSAFNDNASRTSNSVNFTTSYNNTFVIDCMMVSAIVPVVTIGGGQTERYNQTNAFNVRGSTKQQITAGSVTMSWSYDFSQNCELVAFGVREAINLYTKTCSETLVLSDTLLKKPQRILSETLALTDSLLKSTSRAFTETISLTDTLLKLPSRIFTETVSLADTIAKRAGKTLSEIVSFTDTFAGNKIYSKILNEAISLTDNIVKAVGKVLSETISLTDAILRSTLRILTETVVLIDSIITLKTIFRIFDETLFLADSIIKTTGRVLNETLVLADTSIRIINRIFSETLALSDNLIKQLTKVLILNEVINLKDRFIPMLNGLLAWFSDKFTKRGTTFSDKFTKRGTTFSDKFTKRGTTFSDKF